MSLGQMLLFGRQGLGGMLPQNIQQNGLLGSMFKGLGGAAAAGIGQQPPQPTLPPAANTNQANLQPPGSASATAAARAADATATATGAGSRTTVPGASTAGAGGSGQQVSPGQGNPHLPGFDPKSVPFINTPIGGQQQGLNDQGGGLGLLAQLFGGGGLAA
jgi:hypothetical protein